MVPGPEDGQVNIPNGTGGCDEGAFHLESLILEQFNSVQQPLYDRIMCLDEECSAIQEVRDNLLPLLMNGQISVRELK